MGKVFSKDKINPKTTQIILRVNPEYKALVVRAAANKGITVAAMIRQLLSQVI